MDSTLEQAQKPTISIRPGSAWHILNLREIWQYRDLLITLTERDIKLRYRQTALGAIWIVLQPLMAAGILSFVFGKVAKLTSDGLPYIVFSFAGMIGWRTFMDTLVKATGSLVGSAQLVSKIYFPRVILPISTSLSTIIDFLISLGLMFVFMLLYRIPPGIPLLTLPLWLVLLLTLGLGFGLIGASLVVKYRDVANVVVVMTTFLMYASPVAYSVNSVPEHMRKYYCLNPVSGLLDAFRWSLLGNISIPWTYVAYSAVFSVCCFLLGTHVFKRMERSFADII